MTSRSSCCTLRHGAAIESGAARKLAELSAGNPLALIELPTALSPEQLRGPGATPGSAAGRGAESSRPSCGGSTTFRPRPASRSLVAAAGPERPWRRRSSEASQLPSGRLACEPRRPQSLVRVEQDRVHFAHPLLRSAVYHAADRVASPTRPTRHSQQHSPTSPTCSAWQLAAAAWRRPTSRPPPRSRQAAERAVSRGGHAARARALERAAELSPDPAEHARRMCAAAQAAFWAGDSRHAIASASERCRWCKTRSFEPTSSTSSPRWRAGRRTQAILLDLRDGGVARGESGCRSRGEVAPHAPGPYAGASRLRPPGMRSRAQSSTNSSTPRRRGGVHEWPSACLAAALPGGRRRQSAHALYDKTLEPDLDRRRGFLRRVDHLARALRRRTPCLAASLDLGRSDGNVLRVAHCQGVLAIARARPRRPPARAGARERRARSRTDARRGLPGSPSTSSRSRRSTRCRVATTACRENVAAVLDLLPPDRNHDIALSARIALGLLATSRGRFEEAVATLEPIHARVSASGLMEVWRYPYQPNLVEAYARLGRTDEAAPSSTGSRSER